MTELELLAALRAGGGLDVVREDGCWHQPGPPFAACPTGRRFERVDGWVKS
jgi:hypothetical protein